MNRDVSQLGIARHAKPRHGAVAVVVEDGRFLVIRRSQFVRAPNLLCFAGGTIEAGESWGTLLEWVLVERQVDSTPVADPREVSEWMWLLPDELLSHPDLLPSVPDFFIAWARGDVKLPTRAGAPQASWAK